MSRNLPTQNSLKQRRKDCKTMTRGFSYGGLIFFFMGMIFFKDAIDSARIRAFANCASGPVEIDSLSYGFSCFLIIAGVFMTIMSCLPWDRSITNNEQPRTRVDNRVGEIDEDVEEIDLNGSSYHR